MLKKDGRIFILTMKKVFAVELIVSIQLGLDLTAKA